MQFNLVVILFLSKTAAADLVDFYLQNVQGRQKLLLLLQTMVSVGPLHNAVNISGSVLCHQATHMATFFLNFYKLIYAQRDTA